MKRLISEKQHGGSQSVYGIEQRKEEVSLQEVTACQGHPVNMNGMAESRVVISCGHLTQSHILYGLVYVLCLRYLHCRDPLEQCREVRNCGNLEPIMNFLPFLVPMQESFWAITPIPILCRNKKSYKKVFLAVYHND